MVNIDKNVICVVDYSVIVKTTTTVGDKVKNRLEQLDDFEEVTHNF